MGTINARLLAVACALSGLAFGQAAGEGGAAGSAGGSLTREQEELLETLAADPSGGLGLRASKSRMSTMLLSQDQRSWVDVEDGIRYQDVHAGTGNPVVPHAHLFLRWDMFDGQGWGIDIAQDHASTTSQFIYGVTDVNMLGNETALRSFEKGIASMREGGRRLLWIRSDRAYGPEGVDDASMTVPPGTDLVFEVSLMWVRKVDAKRFSPSQPTSRDLSTEGAAVPAARESAAAAAESAPPAP